MTKRMAKELNNTQMGKNIKEISLIVLEMDMAYISFKVEIDIKANGKTMFKME
jgi:hypothetical protein